MILVHLPLMIIDARFIADLPLKDCDFPVRFFNKPLPEVNPSR